MTVKEIAARLVALCRQGQFEQAMNDLYSPDIVSIEPFDNPMTGASRRSEGMAQVAAKTQWWVTNHTIHAMSASDPFVTVDRFAVLFEMDVTSKPMAQRMQMKEVAVYTVANGKIVHEEFLYAMK